MAVSFIAAQAVLVARARFVPDRYFSWAPHDRQIEYRISGTAWDGTPIADVAQSRYGLAAEGWCSHAAEDLEWTIRAREQRTAPELRAREVMLTYRANGGPWKTWSAP